MLTHHETRESPYSPDQLLDLVLDVESYSQFLPWCINSRILSRDHKDRLKAELLIGHRSINHSYVSQIICDRSARTIDVKAIKGPFAHLHNTWTFHEHDGGCKIIFDISFAFKSKLLSRLIGIFFHRAVIAMVGAFEERAHTLYGLTPKVSQTT